MNLALVVAAISLALSVVLFFYFRWYMHLQQKKAAQELLAEYRLEVQGLVADINLAADRDSLLVEERVKTLKKLLEDTDKRIAAYVKELERSRSGEALYARLGQDFRRFAPAAPPAPDTAVPAQVLPMAAVPAGSPPAPQGEAPQPPGKRHPSVKRTPSRKKTPAAPEKQDLRVRIAELAVQGHSAASIASKLKISVSEVELALSLLRK